MKGYNEKSLDLQVQAMFNDFEDKIELDLPLSNEQHKYVLVNRCKFYRLIDKHNVKINFQPSECCNKIKIVGSKINVENAKIEIELTIHNKYKFTKRIIHKINPRWTEKYNKKLKKYAATDKLFKKEPRWRPMYKHMTAIQSKNMIKLVNDNKVHVKTITNRRKALKKIKRFEKKRPKIKNKYYNGINHGKIFGTSKFKRLVNHLSYVSTNQEEFKGKYDVTSNSNKLKILFAFSKFYLIISLLMLDK